MKGEKFPHTGRECGGGIFGATEESAATGVRRAKLRDSCLEEWCQ